MPATVLLALSDHGLAFLEQQQRAFEAFLYGRWSRGLSVAQMILHSRAGARHDVQRPPLLAWAGMRSWQW